MYSSPTLSDKGEKTLDLSWSDKGWKIEAETWRKQSIPSASRDEAGAPEEKQELSTTEEGDLLDLLQGKKLEVRAQGSGMETVHLELHRLVGNPISIDIPAGTIFDAVRSGSPNLVATERERITLKSDEWASLSIPAVCVGRTSKVPDSGDTFEVRRATQEESRMLTPLLERQGVGFAARQAAVWIVAGDATYDDLGTLRQDPAGTGPRVIDERAAAQAMKIVDEAGVDITKKAIWAGRAGIAPKLDEGDVRTWLEDRGKQEVETGAPGTESRSPEGAAEIARCIEILGGGEGVSEKDISAAIVSLDWHGDAAVDPLLEVLENRDPGAGNIVRRLNAVTALGHIGSPKAVDPLKRLTEGEALSDVEKEKAGETVERLTKQRVLYQRQGLSGGAYVLYAFGPRLLDYYNQATDDALNRNLRSPNWEVRLDALAAFLWLNTKKPGRTPVIDTPTVIELLGDEHEDIRTNAAALIATHPVAEAKDALLKALDDGEWPVRLNGVAALEMLGDASAVGPIEKQLADEHVGETAKRALKTLRRKGRR
jgi:hypothetical protein